MPVRWMALGDEDLDVSRAGSLRFAGQPRRLSLRDFRHVSVYVSFRPFRYSRKGAPRSLRLRANSTVAFRNPSLSPVS